MNTLLVQNKKKYDSKWREIILLLIKFTGETLPLNCNSNFLQFPGCHLGTIRGLNVS